MNIDQFIEDLTYRKNQNLLPQGDGDVQRHFDALFTLYGLFTVPVLYNPVFSSQEMNSQVRKIHKDILTYNQPVTIVPVMVPSGNHHARLVLYLYELPTHREWVYDPMEPTRKRKRGKEEHWSILQNAFQIPHTKIEEATSTRGDLPCLLFAAMVLRFKISGSTLEYGAEMLSTWWRKPNDDLRDVYEWHRTIGQEERFGTMQNEKGRRICGVFLGESSVCQSNAQSPSVFCQDHGLHVRSTPPPPPPKVILAPDPALFFIEAFMCDIGVSTRLPVIIQEYEEPLRPANAPINNNSTFKFSEITLPWITLDRAHRGSTCITSALQSLVDKSNHFGNPAKLMTPSYEQRRRIQDCTTSLVQKVTSNNTVCQVLKRSIDTWNIIFNSILDKLPSSENALKRSVEQVEHAYNTNPELRSVLVRLEKCLNKKGDSRPVILPLSLYTNDYRSMTLMTSSLGDPIFAHATVLFFDPKDRTQWYFDPQLHGTEKGQEGLGFFEWMSHNTLVPGFTPNVVIPSKELLSAFSVQTAGDGNDTKFSVGGGCTMFSFLFATLVCRFQARGTHLNSLAEDLTHWLMLEFKREDRIQDYTATRARLYHWQHQCLLHALELSRKYPPPWPLDLQYRIAQMLVGLRQVGAGAAVQRPCGVFLKDGGRCGHPVLKTWTLCDHHHGHLK